MASLQSILLCLPKDKIQLQAGLMWVQGFSFHGDCIHLTDKNDVVWESPLFVRAMLVTVIWKASLHLLCQGSELISFNSVLTLWPLWACTWPDIHLGLKGYNS